MIFIAALVFDSVIALGIYGKLHKIWSALTVLNVFILCYCINNDITFYYYRGAFNLVL